MTPLSVHEQLRRIPMLYHFTDRSNLESIRERGGLYPWATLQERGWTVPAPGGNQLSRELDAIKGLDRFVHLCFRANHPMEYVVRRDDRVAVPIWLQVHSDVLQWEGVTFAPDVANKTGVQAYSIEEAMGMIDFEVLYTRTDWRDPQVRERLQRAEKAEILVPHHIPLELIRGVPNG